MSERMSEQEAMDVITSIVGPVDRPWDTRLRVARQWARPNERAGLEEAARVLELVEGSRNE